MNTYGHVIKFERIRQKIKQINLAQDICSPAYLSKIESNSTLPSEDVLKMLFKRLKINPPSLAISEEEYFSQIQSIYFGALMRKDSIINAIQLSQIIKDQFLFSNPDKYFTYLLMVLRLKILAHNIKYDTYTYLTSISSLSKDFNTYQLFIYYSCLGYFQYFKNEHSLSLKTFEKSFGYHEKIILHPCETADFNYGLGLIYLQNQKILLSIEYIEKAQSYFNSEFLFLRAIESNIAKAVAYKRAELIDLAHENLLTAEKLSEEYNSTEYLSSIFLNRAALYSMNNNFTLSITNYKKSIIIGDDFRSKLISIYNIILDSSKIKNFSEVSNWCEIGIRLYEETPLEELKGLYHHFKCHFSRHSDCESLGSIVIETINYFVSVQDFRNANKYALLLASHYLDEKKYKEATTYYSLAANYLAEKENRKYNEDL